MKDIALGFLGRDTLEMEPYIGDGPFKVEWVKISDNLSRNWLRVTVPGSQNKHNEWYFPESLAKKLAKFIND